MQQADTPTTLTLSDVKQHFDHWRTTRIKQSKIPDSLWSEVKTLIGRYPTSQITTALRVNAHQISSGVAAKSDFTFVAVRPNASPMPTTKSAPSDRANPEATCTFEIHRSSGGILKISAFPVASLVTIINQFVES
jgi:hypothetical protein